MKTEKAYLIGRIGGYGAVPALLFSILGGCTAENAVVCEPQPTQYKVPPAHVEMHERMMAGQRQLIIPNKTDESTDN